MSKKENDAKIKMAKDWVEVYHRDKFKTAITGYESYPSYHVVTRVNYLTSCLWLKWRNSKVNGIKGFVKLSDTPDRANWLIYLRNFKRMQERRIKILNYLEERKSRNSITTNKK